MMITKINWLVLCTSLLSGVLVDAQSTEALGLGRDNLRGNVKEYKSVHYKITEEFGKTVEKVDFVRVHKFSASGLMTERITMVRGGTTLLEKTVYIYDARGKLVEEAEYNFEGSIQTKKIFEYNDKGYRVEETVYAASGALLWKDMFHYDDKGNMVSKEDFSSEGSLTSRENFRYDDVGRQIQEARYNSEGHLSYSWFYRFSKFDEEGRPLQKERYTDTGVANLELVSAKWQYSYDEFGNLTEIQQYRADMSHINTVFNKYDVIGNLIDQSEYRTQNKFGTVVDTLVKHTSYSYTYSN